MKRYPLYYSLPELIFSVFFFVAISGCTRESGKRTNEIKENPVRIIAKPPSSFEDTLTISTASGVFYDSDSLQLEKIRLLNKEMVYQSMVHDCFFQIKNAKTVIKQYWPLLKIIDISKARYLLFIKNDKSKIYIDLNTKNDMCGLFLFDGKKDPVLVDMTNVNTALGDYFSK